MRRSSKRHGDTDAETARSVFRRPRPDGKAARKRLLEDGLTHSGAGFPACVPFGRLSGLRTIRQAGKPAPPLGTNRARQARLHFVTQEDKNQMLYRTLGRTGLKV